MIYYESPCTLKYFCGFTKEKLKIEINTIIFQMFQKPIKLSTPKTFEIK